MPLVKSATGVQLSATCVLLPVMAARRFAGVPGGFKSTLATHGARYVPEIGTILLATMFPVAFEGGVLDTV